MNSAYMTAGEIAAHVEIDRKASVWKLIAKFLGVRLRKRAPVELRGQSINPAHVVSAEVETRHYMNGSASQLVVKLDDGSWIIREHGFGFDAFAALAKIKG